MSDPINIPAGEVTKIAIGVTAGWVRNLTHVEPILAVTRDSPSDEPSVETMLDEGHQIFALDGVNEEIGSSTAIDIYVYTTKIDAKLKVDLPI